MEIDVLIDPQHPVGPGLEVDGVTGQAFLVPFAGKVQLVVGYKGYNTLGARAGLTITGEVVRSGDTQATDAVSPMVVVFAARKASPVSAS